MLGPFTTASRLTPIDQVSQAVLSRAACASMSTTTTTTTTTTRDRRDRYGPMEWAQLVCLSVSVQCVCVCVCVCALVAYRSLVRFVSLSSIVNPFRAVASGAERGGN